MIVGSGNYVKTFSSYGCFRLVDRVGVPERHPHYPWDFFPWRQCTGRMLQLFLSFISFLYSLSCLPHSSLDLILSGGREDALYLFHGLLEVILSHLYQ